MEASRIRLFAAIALCIGIAMPIAANAQDDDVRKRGERACGGDTRKMCKQNVPQGDMAVLGCLQENKNKLSGACRKFLVGVGQLQ